jgi:hypothetical protein
MIAAPASNRLPSAEVSVLRLTLARARRAGKR